jgi:mRNA interferase RelE/StbE
METLCDTGELGRLPGEMVGRILKAVEQLSTDPYPSGVRKLAGSEHTYRIRVGDYRIIYSILASALLIEIIRVEHRRDVYNR